MAVKTYKGFKIQEGQDITTKNPVFNVYTAEEWAYGKGLRSVEWEACTEQEARDFIDSYNTPDEPLKLSGQPLTPELCEIHRQAEQEVAAEEAVKKAAKPVKLSPTMRKVMDKLMAADWYYMRDGKTCGYFVTEGKVRSVGFEGAGIVEGGFIYAQMDSKTLEALRVRGLVEVVRDGGDCLDVVKVAGFEAPERLTKAIHFRARRYWEGRLVQDHQDCYATNEKDIEFARDYFTGDKKEVTVQIDVYGEAELTVWDFFKNK